jgi:transitional endoplasmic reticulum ATPase
VDRLDPALLRPGRFDFLVELPVPDREVRLAIWRVHTRNMPLADEVDLDALAVETEGLVGADIEGLCRRAALLAIREFLEHDQRPVTADDRPLDKFHIGRQHFERALADARRQE